MKLLHVVLEALIFFYLQANLWNIVYVSKYLHSTIPKNVLHIKLYMAEAPGFQFIDTWSKQINVKYCKTVFSSMKLEKEFL